VRTLRRFARLTTVVVAAALAFGCGSSSDGTTGLEEGKSLTVESDAKRVTMELSAEGHDLAQGRNTFLVQFDPPTTMLVGATAFMPVHGHTTPAAPKITEQDGGYLISDFIFSMPGLWNITLDVAVDAKADKIAFSLDVP
jgi:hypothetical protein